MVPNVGTMLVQRGNNVGGVLVPVPLPQKSAYGHDIAQSLKLTAKNKTSRAPEPIISFIMLDLRKACLGRNFPCRPMILIRSVLKSIFSILFLKGEFEPHYLYFVAILLFSRFSEAKRFLIFYHHNRCEGKKWGVNLAF